MPFGSMLPKLILLLSLIPLASCCLATANPTPEPTTTTTPAPCTCQFPRNTAAPECGAGPVNPLPMFTVSKTNPCVVTWSGCTNYRYVINGVCMANIDVNQDPATQKGGYGCMNGFPNNNGQIYQAVDCG